MLATARTFYDVTANSKKINEIIDFHWFRKFSANNNFNEATKAIVKIEEKESMVLEIDNYDFKILEAGIYKIEGALEHPLVVLTKDSSTHQIFFEGNFEPSYLLPGPSFLNIIETDQPNFLLYVPSEHSTTLMKESPINLK